MVGTDIIAMVAGSHISLEKFEGNRQNVHYVPHTEHMYTKCNDNF